MAQPTVPLGKAKEVLQIKVSGSYQTITGVFNLKDPGVDNAGREWSSLDMDYTAKAPSTLSQTDVTAELYFDPTNSMHLLLMAKALNPDGYVLDDFKVLYPQGSFYTFYGFVKSWDPQAGDNKANSTVSFTIAVSSKPLFTS